MDKHNWTVSDLLARRDGKPLDVARARAIADDATAQRDLHRLVALQSELNALPDVAVDDAVWRTAIADASATDLHRVGFGLRYPVATAASVFVATAMFIVYVPSGTNQVEIQPAAADIQIDAAQIRWVGLMSRSRDLEMCLNGALNTVATESSGTRAAQNREARQLLYRKADVDAEIAQLCDSQVMDVDARERLWTQRVRLLENLVLLRGSAGGKFL